MILFLADENFNRRIVRGLRRRSEAINILCVEDCELSRSTDAEILEWAALHHRVVISHDVNTPVGIALERVRLGLPMSGVIAVGNGVEIGSAIEDLLLIGTCAKADELMNQIWYLPLT